MKKICVLLVAVALVSVSVLAGEYLANDTGETVIGLRVVFSEPVVLTAFGDVLTVVEPEGESTEFTFSGRELELWQSHWFSWQPSTASMLEYEWILPERDHPGIHALSRDYLYEFHDSFDSEELRPEWRVEDSSRFFDPGVSAMLVPGAVRIHGDSAVKSHKQTGIYLTGFSFRGDSDFEIVLRLSIAALDPSLVVGIQDPTKPSGLFRLEFNAEGISLFHSRCPLDNTHDVDKPSLDYVYARVAGPITSEGIVVRLTYQASEGRLLCRIDSSPMRGIDLAWTAAEAILIVFGETDANRNGSIDILVEEVHVGTDGELLSE